MTNEEQVSKLKEALEPLGDTVETIAASLIKLGIKGGHNCSSCPVHNYLVSKLGDLDEVFGKKDDWYDCLSHNQKDNPLFETVIRFITQYDIGKFSDLEKEVF